MENATKALLIAAAILIAILIISLSLIVYNMAAQTVGNINLSEAEIAQFNGQFQQYEGKNQAGATVNAMLRTVLNHNIQADSADKKVTVTVKTKSGDTTTTQTLAATAQTLNGISADLGRKYTITCTLRSTNGLVSSIEAKDNSITE